MVWRRQIGLRVVATLAPAVLLVGLSAAMVLGQEAKNDKIAQDGPAVSASEKLVQEQVEAYNRHDLDAFLKTYSSDIKTYAFPDKAMSSGQESMRETYGKIFKRDPDLKVKIANRIVQGEYIIYQEAVSGIARPFTAVAIYRVQEGKISAVWFLK